MKKFTVSVEEKYFRHFEVEAKNEEEAFAKVCTGEVDEIPELSPSEVSLVDIDEWHSKSQFFCPESYKNMAQIVAMEKELGGIDEAGNGYDASPGLEDYFLFDQRGSDE